MQASLTHAYLPGIRTSCGYPSGPLGTGMAQITALLTMITGPERDGN